MRFTAGYSAPSHDHDWHQFSYVSEGAICVTTQTRAFLAAPHQAVWIPAGTNHQEVIRNRATMRSLYFAAGACSGLPAHCAVLNVSPLLRELAIAASECGALDTKSPAQRRLAEMIIERIAALEPAKNQELPMPRDPGLRAIAATLLDQPGNDDTLTTHARRAGLSTRSAQRLIARETGLTFSQWRQRLRLLAASGRLAGGSSVTQTAIDVGYSSVSAFVFAFRREFGVTPGRFVRE